MTFEKRNTHPVPEEFAPPPAGWAKPFAVLAAECGVSNDVEQTFQRVRVFLDELKLN
jgi:hypothetical protein